MAFATHAVTALPPTQSRNYRDRAWDRHTSGKLARNEGLRTVDTVEGLASPSEKANGSDGADTARGSGQSRRSCSSCQHLRRHGHDLHDGLLYRSHPFLCCQASTLSAERSHEVVVAGLGASSFELRFREVLLSWLLRLLRQDVHVRPSASCVRSCRLAFDRFLFSVC
jgi:hypothetical protein